MVSGRPESSESIGPPFEVDQDEETTMSTMRRGYIIGIAAASLTLLGAAGVGAAYASTHSDWNDFPGSMMGSSWTNGSTMMGQGWNQETRFTVSGDQARTNAASWLRTREPDAVIGSMTQTPMGYRFIVTRGDATVGVVLVNGFTGRTTGHAIASSPSGTGSPGFMMR
jgi:hypothetical protein